MHRSEVINRIINEVGAERYLEIGLNMPENNFFYINCKYKESVDPYDHNPGEEICYYEDVREYVRMNFLTYQMTSDQLFEFISEDKKYDVVFIDGWHTEAQVGRDIINSFKHLNKGGKIVVHDCLPSNKEYQTEERNTEIWNGTVWKAIPMLEKLGITYYVIDTDFGCGVLSYDGDVNLLQYPEKADYEYEDVFTNKTIRNAVMHVITKEEFIKRNDEAVNNRLNQK